MLSTTGSFLGLRRNCMYRFISSRPQVTPKNNRKETIRVLKVAVDTSVSVMCS